MERIYSISSYASYPRLFARPLITPITLVSQNPNPTSLGQNDENGHKATDMFHTAWNSSFSVPQILPLNASWSYAKKKESIKIGYKAVGPKKKKKILSDT